MYAVRTGEVSALIVVFRVLFLNCKQYELSLYFFKIDFSTVQAAVCFRSHQYGLLLIEKQDITVTIELPFLFSVKVAW